MQDGGRRQVLAVKSLIDFTGKSSANNLTKKDKRDVSGGITRAADVNLRRALCQAAAVMMHRGRASCLRTWAAKLARRRGSKRAMVALACRIAVILRRMWMNDTDFRLDTPRLHAGCSNSFQIAARLIAGLRGSQGRRFR